VDDTLFDMSEFEGPGKSRKAPESPAQKRLCEIRDMKDRDFRNLQNKLNSGKPLTTAEAKRLEEYQYGYETEAGTNLPDNMVRTGKEVAAYFGKHIRTIRNWTGRGMPQMPDGYDIKKIEQWALREGLLKQPVNGRKGEGGKGGNGETGTGGPCDGENRGSGEMGGDEGSPDVVKDRAYYEEQIKKLDMALKGIKLQKERGELVARSDIAKEWTARATEYANSLDYMETRFPPLLEGKSRSEMRVIIHNECRRIKESLFRTGTFCPAV